jgi:SAM-dependent methyltransferase
MTHASPDTAHAHAHRHDEPGGDGAFLELGSELLAEHTAAVVEWLPVLAQPRQILDLGCGTGSGTFALLQQFPDAEVTAVDASADHLDRLRRKAEADGSGGRVRTVRVDLDADWPDLGRPDLVWASASMHHLAHPDRTLRKVHDLLADDGIFAVVEFGDFPRLLPAEAPEDRPGLEERCHAALASHHTEELPDLGSDWGPRLTAAGFTIAGERTLAVTVDGSASPTVGRYALASFRRVRESVADALDPKDIVALDRLLDADGPGSILHRDDLAFRTERTVWAARRG